ncbi:MAG: DUF86 domain-containing protein [Patescibacteria group bacterium]|jgi:uncharacterized protein with HEPN domain
MERNKLRLLHIRDSIEKIFEYSNEITFDEFAKNNKDYDAILMRIIVIGESVNELGNEFKEQYHDLPWHQAVGLRNQIAHGYIDIKPEIIWDTVKSDLPELKKQVDQILDNY